MEYKQKYGDLELTDAAMDLDMALRSIRYEIAENLRTVNNQYCVEKYPTFYDVFVGYPASDDYDPVMQGLIGLGNRFITLGYALVDANDWTKDQVLRELLVLRAELKKKMRNL